MIRKLVLDGIRNESNTYEDGVYCLTSLDWVYLGVRNEKNLIPKGMDLHGLVRTERFTLTICEV